VQAWCWWISFARTVTLASGTPQISVQLKGAGQPHPGTGDVELSRCRPAY
jgi:hypothetical protein